MISFWAIEREGIGRLRDRGNGSGITRQLRSFLRRPRIPTLIRSHFLPLSLDISAVVEQSLRDNFFAHTNNLNKSPEAYLETTEGRADLDDHLAGRLQVFRTRIIPWLNSLFKLNGARVLEIGSGTGASTVALAEQGAQVVGVDISAAALATARDRCEAYEVRAKFVEANATALASMFRRGDFDFILFFAVLEHLTWTERIESLRAAWDLLDANSILAVIEAPNRLWYVDIHTTDEPFYNWLPDEAAIAYTRYIEGPSSELFREPFEKAKVSLARSGRGVSYHDFVIAWDILASKLPVIGYANEFHENWLGKTVGRLSAGSRYRKFLSKVVPDLHPAFLEASLDLAFRKSELRQTTLSCLVARDSVVRVDHI